MTTDLECNSICSFLYNWQTLLAGMLALAGAFLTVWKLETQISLQRKQYENDKERSKLAARAKMPDALSDICNYLDDVGAFLIAVIQENTSLEFPKKPKEAIENLKISLEHIDIDASERVFDLIRFYQVHNSRLEKFKSPLLNSSGFGCRTSYVSHQHFIDLAELRVKTENLFDYARHSNTVDGVEFKFSNGSASEDRLHSALRISLNRKHEMIPDQIWKIICEDFKNA